MSNTPNWPFPTTPNPTLWTKAQVAAYRRKQQQQVPEAPFVGSAA
jgi:hypothetical protein